MALVGRGGHAGEADLLRIAYESSFALAALIVLTQILTSLKEYSQIKEVVMVCIDENTLHTYQSAFLVIFSKK